MALAKVIESTLSRKLFLGSGKLSLSAKCLYSSNPDWVPTPRPTHTDQVRN